MKLLNKIKHKIRNNEDYILYAVLGVFTFFGVLTIIFFWITMSVMEKW